MNKTPIPWADYTWNPITGCTKGCEYCYARGIAKRFGTKYYDDRQLPYWVAEHDQGMSKDFKPMVHPHRLAEPLKLRKPSGIFLGSMGDLFDPAFPDEFRDRVFAIVAATPQHTYLLLTKQAANMRRYFGDDDRGKLVWDWHTAGGHAPSWVSWPLFNLHLGVTVTNQADADERIPLLLDTPAAVRWVSVEPMLGPVDLLATPMLDGDHLYPESLRHVMGAGIDWVVVGGKTPGKPLHEGLNRFQRWSAEHGTIPAPSSCVRFLRDQCEAAGVPFFYKHGSTIPELDGVKHDALPREATDV